MALVQLNRHAALDAVLCELLPDTLMDLSERDMQHSSKQSVSVL